VAGSCEYGDEPLGSGATELIMRKVLQNYTHLTHITTPSLMWNVGSTVANHSASSEHLSTAAWL
jgi:hypothetical protein